MKNTEVGHKQVDFIIKLIQISFCVAVAVIAISLLTIYIFLAKNYPPVLDKDGILTGYFFLFLIFGLIFCFIFYVLKNIMQMKIGYFDDVKYIRDHICTMSNVLRAIDESTDVSTSNSNNSKESSAKYYLLNKSGMYLNNIFVPQNGPTACGLCRDIKFAKRFDSRAQLIQYAKENNINIVNDFEIVQQ